MHVRLGGGYNTRERGGVDAPSIRTSIHPSIHPFTSTHTTHAPERHRHAASQLGGGANGSNGSGGHHQANTSVTSTISKFGVGAIHAGFFIGQRIKVVTSTRVRAFVDVVCVLVRIKS